MQETHPWLFTDDKDEKVLTAGFHGCVFQAEEDFFVKMLNFVKQFMWLD